MTPPNFLSGVQTALPIRRCLRPECAQNQNSCWQKWLLFVNCFFADLQVVFRNSCKNWRLRRFLPRILRRQERCVLRVPWVGRTPLLFLFLFSGYFGFPAGAHFLFRFSLLRFLFFLSPCEPWVRWPSMFSNTCFAVHLNRRFLLWCGLRSARTIGDQRVAGILRKSSKSYVPNPGIPSDEKYANWFHSLSRLCQIGLF